MADRTVIGRVDKQEIGLVPTSQTSRHGMLHRRRPRATAFHSPLRPGAESQTLCPKCGHSAERNDLPFERESATYGVKEDKPDSFCNACGHEFAAGHPRRRSSAINDSDGAVES